MTEVFPVLVPARPAFAGMAGDARAIAPASYPASSRRRAARRAGVFARLERFAGRHGVGSFLALAFVGGVGLAGAVHGGQYDRFVADNGSLPDVAARALGFGIDAITITGTRELGEGEILAAAGITPRNSLLFLDVNTVRDRLAAVPLVLEANVRKLFPNRLIVEIVEREPFAIWQKDGALNLVSADGQPMMEMRDARFAALPFVVGEGANRRVAEFMRIVAAAGDLRGRVRAGALIGERRWNLTLSNGIEVKLPEQDPEAAAAQLGRLARDARLLDKDVVSLDFRFPGKMFARLTDEAAAARAETLPKAKKRGPA